jgi:hypothetical protein
MESQPTCGRNGDCAWRAATQTVHEVRVNACGERMKTILIPILMIVAGLAVAAAANHGPASGVLAGLILAGLGAVRLFAGLFQSLDGSPEDASGAPLSMDKGALGLDAIETAERSTASGQSVSMIPLPKQELTPVQAAVRGVLIDSVHKTPIVVEEPYACLEMLLRELPDGPEVRSVVVAVRIGIAKAIRQQHDINGEVLDTFTRTLCESEGIPADLARWTVCTWAEAFRAKPNSPPRTTPSDEEKGFWSKEIG